MSVSLVQNDVSRRTAHDGGAPRDLRALKLDKDRWYPLARAGHLRPGATLPVSFAGEAIVLVRGERGALYALEDRCAHRQVPLSKGVVKGDRLQCNYHCWTYEKTGRCVSVPYLDAEKTEPVGVKAYAAKEAYGFVWVFPGDQDKAEKTALPDIPAYDDPEYKTRFLDRQIGCHWSFMHENLMDMNHQFLHRRLMGSIKATLQDVRRGEGCVEAEYTFSRLAGRQSFGEKIMTGTERKKHEGRGRDYMVIRTAYPYQSLQFFVAGKDKPALDLWNFYMPLDAEERRNQTFGLMMIRKPKKLPGLMNALWPLVIWFTESIFAEDQDIVEQEQRAWDEQGRDENREVFPPILALREHLVSQTPG